MKDFDEMVNTVREKATAPDEVRGRVDAALDALTSTQGSAQPQAPELTVVESIGTHKGRRVLRARWAATAGVAAAAALALCVAMSPLGGSGTVALAPQAASVASSAASGASALANAFTLQAAYGSETASGSAGDGSQIAFWDQGSGRFGGGQGCYTGLVFKVAGDNIARVSATLDKGQLYRLTRTEWTEADEREFLDSGKQMDGKGFTHMIHSSDENAESGSADGFYDDFCEVLGASFDEAYNANLAYGFYQPASVCDEVEKQFEGDEDDMPKEFHALIDEFDGGTLTVTVIYTDGSTETKAYGLQSGKLKVEYAEKGEEYQTLQKFTDGENEPYSYGLLATLK